jgi:uncharacterized membrane protein
VHYLGLKLLHIVAVVLFLGNITTGVFWKRHADRSRDPRLILAGIEGLIRSDRLFTIPGVIAITVFGLAAAIAGHYPILRTGWIFWSLVLFAISGWAFMAQVAPLQRRLAAMARRAVESGTLDWNAYHALSRRWEFWGAVALLAPAGAMALMVLKPSWPGLPGH